MSIVKNTNLTDTQMTKNHYLNKLLRDPVETLFGDLFSPLDWGMERHKNKDGTLSISVDIPGINENQIAIESSHGLISIKGERKTLTSSYSFHKDFSIPEGYNSENIKAELSNGVLTLTFQPHSSSSEEVKKIPITT